MKTPVKILIFGKHGQVGSQLVEQFGAASDALDPNDFQIIATDIEDVDLTDSEATKQLVLHHHPDWVINTSAHTAVDKAESEPDLAHQLNALAPGVIARACHQIGATMVHYSTDYIFDGCASVPYLEDDEPNPRSVYGKTKLEGERLVADALEQYFIFRTAWVYSPTGKNFVNTMLRLAADRDELKVVGDQYGSPTLADDLASATISVVQKAIADPDPSAYGVYHATGGGNTSWAGFSQEIMRLSGNQHVKVVAITTEEYPTPAPRPAFSVLDNAKLHNRFGLQLQPWENALERCLKKIDK